MYQRPEMPERPLGKPDLRLLFPWSLDQVLQGKTIIVSKLDDLPSEATPDKESWLRFGTRSVVVVPLPIGSGVLGAVTFASAQERSSWPEPLVKRLQLVARVFGNAIARARSDAALRESEAHLRQTLDEIQRLRDQLQQQNVYLQQEVKLLHGHTRIIGQSQTLKRVLAQVEQVAPTGSTVLLLGETGTGKELIASAIHELSSRRSHPMVRVNCSAIPASLIESELFGREKGAYTGALSKQIGRFELANGSTLFLDEIGDLPPDIQVKLLRVLQEKQIRAPRQSQEHSCGCANHRRHES